MSDTNDVRPKPLSLPPSLRCRVCGYGLGGLSRDGVCPECGNPVARSLRGNMLEFASAAYVGRLAWGARLVILALVATLAWIVAAPLVIELLVRPNRLSMAAGSLIIQLLDVAGIALSIAGWWLLTTRDPAMHDTETDVRARRALRGLLLFVMIGTLAGLFALLVPALNRSGLGALIGNISITPNTQFTAPFVAALAFRVLLILAKLASFFVGLIYVRELALRIPDPRLHAWARRLLWLVPTLATVGILVCGLGPLVAFGLYAWTMWKCVRAMAEVQARMASEHANPIT